MKKKRLKAEKSINQIKENHKQCKGDKGKTRTNPKTNIRGRRLER